MSLRFFRVFCTVSFLFTSGCQTAALALEPAPHFAIAPYIFSSHGEKIGIAWAYDQTLTSPRRVTFHLVDGQAKKDIEVTSHNGLFSLDIPIAPCDFGSQVSYQMPGLDRPITIDEIHCASANEATRFTFIADTQEGLVSDQAFAESIKTFGGSAVIVGGDLVQDGSVMSEWVDFFHAMAPFLASQMLIPVVGNHEYRHDERVPLWKHFFNFDAADGYYGVDIGPAHVIVLNSAFWNDPSFRLKQLVWLKDELEKPAVFKIVTFHHPPFTKSIFSHWAYPKKEYKILQADYVPLFEEYKVDLVLNGHTHIYEHSLKHNVHYITTGAAGGHSGYLGGRNPYELQFLKVRTMVQIEATHTSLQVIAKTANGQIVDHLVIQK